MSLLPKSVIGEPNSDSRQKEFYDRRREAESSRDRGHDYAKDSDRSKDYGKDRERDRRSGNDRDPRGSGQDPTPDRRSHFKERVVDHKKRTEVARDKKGGQDLKERRRKFSPQMEKSGKWSIIFMLDRLLSSPRFAKFDISI